MRFFATVEVGLDCAAGFAADPGGGGGAIRRSAANTADEEAKGSLLESRRQGLWLILKQAPHGGFEFLEIHGLGEVGVEAGVLGAVVELRMENADRGMRI